MLNALFLQGSNKRKRKLKDTGVAAAEEVGVLILVSIVLDLKAFRESNYIAFLLKFGHLLDENIGSKFDNIGMNAMANKDNASK